MAGHVRTLVAIGDAKAKGCRYVSGGKPEIQSVRDRHKFHVNVSGLPSETQYYQLCNLHQINLSLLEKPVKYKKWRITFMSVIKSAY